MASVPLFLEWEATIKRPEHRLVHGLDLIELDSLLTDLASLVVPVELHMLWRPQLRDPGDEMVLETAINGRAEAIVTWNLRDFSEAASRFGISVLNPQDAVRKWQL